MNMNVNNKTVIIGCGGIGTLVVRLLLQQSIKPTTVTRTVDNSILPEQHITADLDDVDTLSDLDIDNAIVFYFAPPQAAGATEQRMHNFLQSVSQQTPLRIVYISTTGVYGDTQGEWVTENSRTNPSNDRAKRRLDAEQQLTVFCQSKSVSLVILRVPGIYGSQRLPVDRIKQGRPVVKELQTFTNRIHEDDLAQICIIAAESQSPAGIYNVSDGQPGNMTQYFTEVAAALNLPVLPQISWQEAQTVMSPEMLSYLKESRRIDNTKMLKELQIKLLYPDFSSGLKASVELLGK